MKLVNEDKDWYLLCPDTCSGLTNAYGKKYEELLWTYLIRCGMKDIEISHNVWEQLNEIKNMDF
jgi:hypothetical protein